MPQRNIAFDPNHSDVFPCLAPVNKHNIT